MRSLGEFRYVRVRLHGSAPRVLRMRKRALCGDELWNVKSLTVIITGITLWFIVLRKLLPYANISYTNSVNVKSSSAKWSAVLEKIAK